MTTKLKSYNDKINRDFQDKKSDPKRLPLCLFGSNSTQFCVQDKN